MLILDIKPTYHHAIPFQGERYSPIPIQANVVIVSFLVTLKLVGVDAHLFLNRRLVSLHQGEHIVLGRISKNLRTEFTAKSTNGYFDNPIISRRHALLENLWGEVYLTDQASTHGTFLNGVKLIPWVKRRVEN